MEGSNQEYPFCECFLRVSEQDLRLSSLIALALFSGAISMRLSISDSKSTALTYAKVVAGICAVLMIAIEDFLHFICSSMIPLTYARISRQYDEAVKTRPAGPGEPPCVLNGRQIP